MAKRSATGRTVRKRAADIPAATSSDLNRLRAAMRAPVDMSEIPERRRFVSLKRGPDGSLPPRRSIIREAVQREMRRLHLTAYRLWKMARAHYPVLSQSAVHEFLKGERQLELPSAEALLAAVQLRLVPNGAEQGREPTRAAREGPTKRLPKSRTS
jgi:hypothetical protein